MVTGEKSGNDQGLERAGAQHTVMFIYRRVQGNTERPQLGQRDVVTASAAAACLVLHVLPASGNCLRVCAEARCEALQYIPDDTAHQQEPAGTQSNSVIARHECLMICRRWLPPASTMHARTAFIDGSKHHMTSKDHTSARLPHIESHRCM